MEKKGLHSPFPHHVRTIFVDTSIDTHLLLTVSLHDTIREVKAKIKAEHALSFQDIGEISIRALKVRRRGFFYNVSDSMCVWNVFYGFKGIWSLYIDAVPMSTMKNSDVCASKGTHEQMDDIAHEIVGITTPCESEMKSVFDGQGSHDFSFMNHCKLETSIDQAKVEAQFGGRSIFSLSEKLGEHLKDGRGGSKSETLASTEGLLLSKLSYWNPIPLQVPQPKKHKKRKRKSAKLHQDVHFDMPSETLVSPSSHANADQKSNGCLSAAGHPSINLPPDFSQASNELTGQASEIRITSQRPSVAHQAVSCYSRRKSKRKRSKLRSSILSDSVLVESNEEVSEFSEERKLANDSNQKTEEHCKDANAAVSPSINNSLNLTKISQVKLSDPPACEQQCSHEQIYGEILIKGSDATHVLSDEAMDCGRKMSEQEALKAQVPSEMNEHAELLHRVSLVPCQSLADSPPDIVMSSSSSSSSSRGPHIDEGPLQKESENHRYRDVNDVHGTAAEDSNADKTEKTKQPNELSSLKINESSSFLHKDHDDEPQKQVHLSKSGSMESKHGKITGNGMEETLSLASDIGIDKTVAHNAVIGSAPSEEGTNNQTISSDDTEDIPYHLRRFIVVRKIPIRRPKNIIRSNGEERLDSSEDDDKPYHLRRFRVVGKVPINSKNITHNSNGKTLLSISEEDDKPYNLRRFRAVRKISCKSFPATLNKLTGHLDPFQ